MYICFLTDFCFIAKENYIFLGAQFVPCNRDGTPLKLLKAEHIMESRHTH